MYKLLLFALGLCQVAVADQWFWWDVTWVQAAPDGFSRPVIGINGQWPCPPIVADVGERITIFMNNKLGNESTSLHFHGISQFGSNTMDGPSAVTQCPVPPGMKGV
jgi:iron transport multicopper oxidase